MEYKEILTKAIKKAIKNGWTHFNDITCLSEDDFIINGFGSYQVSKDSIYYDGGWDNSWCCSIRDIIFSHDFTKAFWGENICSDIDGEVLDNTIWEENDIHCTKLWKFHLQQMVLEKKPLKYLERFLAC